MNKYILISFFFCLSSFVLAAKSPKIKKGEVKVSFDCSAFPVPQKEVERTQISFFKNERSELIIRSRQSETSDVTVKFRPSSEQELLLNDELYDDLKEKSDQSKEEARRSGQKQALSLKCEADIFLGPKMTPSCSLTTTTTNLTTDHQTFSKMCGKQLGGSALEEFGKIEIKGISWKSKGYSIERWEVKNRSGKEVCFLEVSQKFEVSDVPKDDLPKRLKEAGKVEILKLLGTFVDLKPLSEQGDKTSKAFEAANSL
jgi:hypothetical protein